MQSVHFIPPIIMYYINNVFFCSFDKHFFFLKNHVLPPEEKPEKNHVNTNNPHDNKKQN